MNHLHPPQSPINKKNEGELLEKLADWLKRTLTKNNLFLLRPYHLKEKRFTLNLFILLSKVNKAIISEECSDTSQHLLQVVYQMQNNPKDDGFWLQNALNIIEIPNLVHLTHTESKNEFNLCQQMCDKLEENNELR